MLAAVGWGASGERRWTKVVASVGEHGGEGRDAAVTAQPASGEDGGGDGCVVATGRTTVGSTAVSGREDGRHCEGWLSPPCVSIFVVS